MTVRLVLCLVFMSAMLIARPVVAQSPYFNEYIDHHKFVRLTPAEQRDFLVALMQTVADMEQKAIAAGMLRAPADAQKTVHQRRWEQVKKALESFTRQLAVGSAYADSVPPYNQTCFSPGQVSAQPVMENGARASCLFGSYRSTYVRSGTGSGKYCQRPSCSIDPEIRGNYARISSLGGCNKNQMACNPALFGYDNAGTPTQKPTCVQLDVEVNGSRVNSVHNASLSCLIAVTNDVNSTNRLDLIATAIRDSRATAEEFNKLLHSITNLCICDGQVGADAEVPPYLRDMSNTYSQYIADHRTCNALLSQTSLVLKKLDAQGGRCVGELLPANIKNLSEDLSYIDNFSAHFHKLARGDGAADQRLTDAQINRALVQYRGRWVVAEGTQVSGSDVTRVAEDAALDNVASYIAAGEALKARSDSNINRWCPLRFPAPEVPAQTLTCTIGSASSTRAEDGKVSVSATVTVVGLGDGVTPGNIEWKVNGAVVAEQTATALAAENIADIAADAASVPVQATYLPPGGLPVVCEGAAAFAAAPACAISIGEVTPHTDGKFKATVEATFTTINPDAIEWTPNDVASGTAAAVDRTRQVVFNAPSGDTREVSVSIVATTGTQRAECRETKTLPAAAETTACTLNLDPVARPDGKYSISASLIGTTDATKPEGEPTYTGFTFSTANGIGIAVVERTDELQTKEVTATYTDKNGKSYSCKQTAVIPARDPPAANGGGFVPQHQGPMVIPRAGGSLFIPGLR